MAQLVQLGSLVVFHFVSGNGSVCQIVQAGSKHQVCTFKGAISVRTQPTPMVEHDRFHRGQSANQPKSPPERSRLGTVRMCRFVLLPFSNLRKKRTSTNKCLITCIKTLPCQIIGVDLLQQRMDPEDQVAAGSCRKNLLADLTELCPTFWSQHAGVEHAL